MGGGCMHTLVGWLVGWGGGGGGGLNMCLHTRHQTALSRRHQAMPSPQPLLLPPSPWILSTYSTVKSPLSHNSQGLSHHHLTHDSHGFCQHPHSQYPGILSTYITEKHSLITIPMDSVNMYQFENILSVSKLFCKLCQHKRNKNFLSVSGPSTQWILSTHTYTMPSTSPTSLPSSVSLNFVNMHLCAPPSPSPAPTPSSHLAVERCS